MRHTPADEWRKCLTHSSELKAEFTVNPTILRDPNRYQWKKLNHRRTDIKRQDGFKLYEATIVDNNYLAKRGGWNQITVLYWSKHPVLDLDRALVGTFTVKQIAERLNALNPPAA
jgi:hypothetical protein